VLMTACCSAFPQDEEWLVDELLALGMGFSRKDCEAATMQARSNLQVAVNLLIG
jgi:hypothetical protein